MGNAKEIAWASGLFEGEGCICFTGKYSVALGVNLTDHDTLERFARIVSVGRVTGPYQHTTSIHGTVGKPMWSWKASQQDDVRKTLRRMLPWLGARRTTRAHDALTRLKAVRRPGRCHLGHLMSGPNLYLPPCGMRICRLCARRRDKQRVRKRKTKS